MLRQELTFDVSCKKITDARLRQLRFVVSRDPHFLQLTTLHLFDNRITSRGMNEVCKLNPRFVTTIWLGHNRIEDRGIVTFVSTEWPVLVHLFLDDNFIGDTGAAHLTQLKQVRRLGMHTNCLTEQGIALLQRMRYEILWVQSQRVRNRR